MNRLTSVRSKSMWLASVFMVVFLLFGWMATGLAQENIVDINALTQAFRDVKRARVVVRQTYEEADKVSLPFYEYAEKILNYAGLSVVEEDASTYDATISIEAKGIPGSASYTGTMGGSHWNKATVEGKISFSAGDKAFRWDFSYTVGPYQTITRSYPTPNDAPFKAAFDGGFIPAFFKAIAKVLGMPPLISALKDEDEDVRRRAVGVLGEINPKWRETEEAKRKVPEFISALKDED
ncbi:MAG: HEAT repeat domain-containing protein, partial [Candidatus Atribacteria bacterium]